MNDAPQKPRIAVNPGHAREPGAQREERSLPRGICHEPTTCPICCVPGRVDAFSRGMDPAGTPSFRAIAERALELEVADGSPDPRAFTALALLAGRGRNERIESVLRELLGADGARAAVNGLLTVAQARIAVSVREGGDVAGEEGRAIDMVTRLSPLQDNVNRDEVRRAIAHHGTAAVPGRPPNGKAERAAHTAARRRADQHQATLAGLSGSGARPESDKVLRSRAKKKRQNS